jgi:hypothetical protein
MAAHAKPAGADAKGFRALIGVPSTDFRPLPKFPSLADSEFPPLPAPWQPSPAMAMRPTAQPQASCHGATSGGVLSTTTEWQGCAAWGHPPTTALWPSTLPVPNTGAGEFGIMMRSMLPRRGPAR